MSTKNLRNGMAQSCGCLRIERARASRITHGHSLNYKPSPTYRIWQSMIDRCENLQAKDYLYYGGRGIAVCDRWRDFESFLVDMGEKPDGLTLERVNNDHNYEPANCKWATRSEQSRNSRTTRLSPELVLEVHGRVEHGESMASVARRLGVSESCVAHARAGRTWKDLR